MILTEKGKTGKTAYRSSPIKRKRRSKQDIESLCRDILEIVAKQQPMTVRQVFYRLVVAGKIKKTEAEYKGTVCRLLAGMRRRGELPYEWIADNTRWMRKPDTYSGLDEMLRLSQQTYRRALWNDQDAYVEVWLEKEALAGVLVGTTAEYDVPLMVTRGYPSISFLHSAGEAISAIEKPVFLYYFGDRDPSGVDIDRFVESEIRKHAPGCDLTFQRVAVLEEQIEEYGLPTRPTKKSDSRAKNFNGESVEVDAIEPDMLRELGHECITKHIDQDQLDRTRVAEKVERGTLAMYVKDLEGQQ